jgi:hypothetical protein
MQLSVGELWLNAFPHRDILSLTGMCVAAAHVLCSCEPAGLCAWFGPGVWA